MKLVVSVTKRDYQEYSKYTYNRMLGDNQSSAKGFIKNIILWAIIAIIVMSVFNNPLWNHELIKSFHFPTALITAAPMLIFITLMVFYIKRIQKLSIPKDDGLLLGSKEIEVDDKGITETNTFGTSYYKWSSVESVEEVNGNVYVYFDTILGYIFPKICFKDDNERKELIETINKNTA